MEKEFDYVKIMLDCNKNKSILLGFKKEKNADNFCEQLLNISDCTVFSVDLLGRYNENEIKIDNNVVLYSTIHTDKDVENNPDRLVRKIYRILN